MDSTTLPSQTPLLITEESVALVSLYEALQELPDIRRAEAQTLLVGVDPLLRHSCEVSRSDKLKWSD